LESAFQFTDGGGTTEYDPEAPEEFGKLLKLVGTEVRSGFADDDGSLVICFLNDATLSTGPDPQFES
jgi:uncharacterized protein DUF6188